MRVGVIQSSFIPWRGYFDFIASVDAFVFHDDIQYTKGDWRNRNKIKTAKGSEWLSVPVSYKSVSQLICDTPIDNSTHWAKRHLRIWQAHYQAAPYFGATKEILALMNDNDDATISQLNIKLIRNICEYLGISTPMMLSSELALEGSKTERLIDLLRKLNASTYLSGPSADAYLDKEAFRRNGIQLEYKSYDYAPYSQLWGDFIDEVTVLDLIANCGPEARNYIRSRAPNTVVIERRSS
nr:WbqC family protein [uncultured Acidovorax sp.]